MGDESLSQRPLVQLPASKVLAAARSPLALQRNPITPKLANHLVKYSARLAGHPHNLQRGAKYVVDWVNNRLLQEPAQDIAGVLGDDVVAVRPALPAFLAWAWALTPHLQWWPLPMLVFKTRTKPARRLPWPTTWLLPCTSTMVSIGPKLSLQWNAPRRLLQLRRRARRALHRSGGGNLCRVATLWT